MGSDSDVEVLDAHPCSLGEGPVWDDRTGEVLWVDIVGKQIHRRTLQGERSTVWFDLAVGAVAPCEGEGWIVALEDALVRRYADGSIEQLASFADVDTAPAVVPVRANDAACDARGRFWVGTMAWDATANAGSLYCLDPHRGSFRQVLTDVSISNGLGWSPDDTAMYYVDTATGAIDVMDYAPETGQFRDRRHLVEIPADLGAPDGLTVDAEGGIWVALWGGGAVHRYTPDGRLDRAIRLPCSQVTSCAFVGPSLDRLVITTASIGLERPEAGAGCTFVADPRVPGRPAFRFAA